MAMTKSEEKLKDLNLDFLIKISNLTINCPDTKEDYKQGIFIITAAIIVTTGEGRYEFQHRKTNNEEATVVGKLLDKYYEMARVRGVYALVKNEEHQLINPTDEKTNVH